MGFDVSAGMSSSSGVEWGNLAQYDALEVGVTGGLSDIWDLRSMQASGRSDIDKWPADESTCDEHEVKLASIKMIYIGKWIHRLPFMLPIDDYMDFSNC